MKSRAINSKKDKFLQQFKNLISIEDADCLIASRSKFNFYYFSTNQEHACSFQDWGEDNSVQFLNKLISYSQYSLQELKSLPIGSGKNRRNLLEIYGVFPAHSNFTYPTHVPHQALWGRIRLDNLKRLIGFLIPDSYHGIPDKNRGVPYDKNTFYVVFIDNHHNFYPSKKR